MGIAYRLDEITINDERTVLVYDLGGTSLDVTVMLVDQGVYEVLGNERVESWPGVRRIDGNVAGWVMKEVAARMGRRGGGGGHGHGHGAQRLGHMAAADLMRLDASLVERVKEETAEKVKMALSEKEAVEIDIGEMLTNLGGMDKNLTMTRRDFENLNHVLVHDTLLAVRRVLAASKVAWNDVDDVLVVGGSGKIPLVREVVESYFRREDRTPKKGDVDPSEAVIVGATVQAMVSEDRDIEV